MRTADTGNQCCVAGSGDGYLVSQVNVTVSGWTAESAV